MNIYITIVYITCIIIYSVMGYLVMSQDKSTKINRIFFLMTVWTIIWSITSYIIFSINPKLHPDIFDICIKITFGMLTPGTLLLVLFFYYFPQKTVQFPKILEQIYIIYTLFLTILTVSTPLINKGQVIENGKYISDVLGSMYWIYASHPVLSVILVIYLVIVKYRNATKNKINKILFPFYGIMIFTLIIILTNVVSPLLGIKDVLFFQKIAPPFSLIMIFFMFYSLYKYRSISISLLSLNILRKIILLVIFIGTIFTLSILTKTIVPTYSDVINLVINPIIALLIIIKLDKTFPELLTVNFKRFRSIIQKLVADIYYCKTYREFERLLEYTFVMQLNLSKLEIFIIREKKVNVKENIPIYIEDKYSKQIKKNMPIILVHNELETQNTEESKIYLNYLQKISANICIPLYSSKKLIGLINIGTYNKDKPLNREEIKEILNIKKDIETSFMNVLLTNNLQVENNIMKQIVDAKTKNLKKQNIKTNKILNQQQDFIAVTAHEFRTPLSIAMFQLEDTMESYKHDKNVIEEMKTMESSLQDLKNLTQKMFDVQQYDLNKIELNLNTIILNQLLQTTYDDFIPIMEQKNINFKLNIPSKAYKIDIDKGQIRQVLHNLLTNAFKFTPSGGTITINMETDTTSIIIKITDSGPGIPREMRKSVFKKFRTVRASMGMGIGLGLYLCKKIMKLHKGHVWVEDSNYGAIFCVKFPYDS